MEREEYIMKKTIITALAILVIGTMTACSSVNETPSAEETTTTEAVAETTTEPETPEESEETAEPEETKTITGEILDAAMNTIIIRTEDGVDLIFSKEDAESDLKDGLKIGNSVVIEYTGEIVGNNASDTRVLKISDDVSE